MGDPGRTFDETRRVEPPLRDEQIAEVPARGGILLLRDAAGRPIVLLTAADLRARLRTRLSEPVEGEKSRRADLREITREILWRLAWSHFEADWQYLETARRLWPGRYGRMVAWKPAWFVHVDVGETYPHFRRRRDVFAQAGEYFGPMPDGRAADRFVAALQDGFDLCRNYQCLRKSPHGPRCAYAEMGRCLCPCDGTIPLGEYRLTVAEAAEAARGRAAGATARLASRMKAAAAALDFERAAGIKTRLERLAELSSPSLAHVRPAEAFRFLIVQPGPGRQTARAFLADRGSIAAAGELNYPLVKAQLRRLLVAMARLSARPSPRPDDAAALRIALVARYLLSSPKRRGLILHWRQDLTAENLGEAIERAREALRLREPARRRGKAQKKDPSKSPPAGV